MNENEIRVRVKDGFLVAKRNPDPNYDGIYIVFEADNKFVMDIVTVECKEENNRKEIDTYCYSNIYSDEWTDKFSLPCEEMARLLTEE